MSGPGDRQGVQSMSIGVPDDDDTVLPATLSQEVLQESQELI